MDALFLGCAALFAAKPLLRLFWPNLSHKSTGTITS